jgi:hypothetical protein
MLCGIACLFFTSLAVAFALTAGGRRASRRGHVLLVRGQTGRGNNYVLNASFEADRVAMTVPACWKATNGSNVESGHTGRWSWQLTANGSLEQRIAAIPEGRYKLSVWAKTGGTSGQLYAKGCGTDAMMPISGSTSFANVTLSGVAVSGGQCTVGVTAGSGELTVDDFLLSDT